MTLDEKIKSAEAIIFASGDGVAPSLLMETLEADEKELQYILDSIKERYGSERSGINLNTNSEWVSFVCAKSTDEVVYKALSIKKNTPLSNAAMETLAIIAYNQPVSRSFIERVRGVDSSSSVRTLVSRGLVEETGRLDIPGHPISYGTTPLFLRSFSINSLSELPKIKPEEEEGQLSTDDLELLDGEE